MWLFQVAIAGETVDHFIRRRSILRCDPHYALAAGTCATAETYRTLWLSCWTNNADVRTAFRTAAIKSFEYSYELAIKLIRRHLELADSAELVDAMDFRTLIRTAAERGLIVDPAAWFLFREKRNITAHTYDETKALDVLGHLPAFATAVGQLLNAVSQPHAS